METIEQIKEDEGGYSSEVYLCTAGKLTWLYGRNIEDRPIADNEWAELAFILGRTGTMKEWALSLFNHEINIIKCELIERNFFLDDYPEEVTVIIINMAYNMGLTKFNPEKWPNFFTAIKDRDWKLAAAHGRDSLWFFQVGNRSMRLMKSLERVESD